MRRTFVALVVLSLIPAVALAQADRRGRSTPGLVLNTGARTGACDKLFFTADGRELLAAGDDKIVLAVPLTEGKTGATLDGTAARTLRWPIWREQRGAIYAADLSPDPGQRFVAVGGFGVKTGAVAVLDRATGSVVHLLDENLQDQTIWAVAFAPDGNVVAFGAEDGYVGLWNLAGKTNDVTVLVPSAPAGTRNPVRLLSFRDAKHLLAVTADGFVREYDIGNPAAPKQLFETTVKNLRVATLSADRRWLAAVSEFDSPDGWLEVVDLQAKESSRPQNPLQRPKDRPGVEYTLLAHCVAFDAKSERLAVGYRCVQTKPAFPAFAKVHHGGVGFYDLTRGLPPATGTVETPIILNNYPEALAFHPADANLLATAGGDNHAMVLWDVASPAKPRSVVRGPGAGVWSVAFSSDGLAVGFQQQRNPDPPTPNERGTGPVRVFDLDKSELRSDAAGFEPVKPVETLDGWTVKPGWSDWSLVDPNGRAHPLVDKRFFDLPMCHTFVKPVGDKPARLVVGHYWGATLYELTPAGPKLVRHFIGHGGEVTALGIDPNREKLVTASRDQTICFWSLDGWPSHPELGAAFKLDDGKLLIDTVDPGGPAWETGLEVGDQIVGVYFTQAKDHFVYSLDDRDLKAKHGIQVAADAKVGTVQEAAGRLKDAVVPNQEIQFVLNRRGVAVHTRMTTIQRPVVRLVPLRPEYSDAFLVYRWRDYVYHAKGEEADRIAGWHVNAAADADPTPSFQPLGTLYKTLHDADKLRRTLQRLTGDAALVQLREWEQPKVTVALKTEFQGRGDVPLVVSAKPVGEGPLQKVVRAEVWVDDARHADFDVGQLRDGVLEQSLTLERATLPGGAFRVQVRAFNAAAIEGRSEELRVVLPAPAAATPRKKGKLHVLAVGVSEYAKFKLPGNLPDLPHAIGDARALAAALNAQRGRELYEGGETVELIGPAVTPLGVLQTINQLNRHTIGGNDLAVLFLAGHGVAAADGSFQFVCYGGSKLDGHQLSRAWAGVRCHKVALVDAHNAGRLTLEGSAARALSEGMPMLIYAASQPDERAAADGQHGLFARALLAALGEQFRQAAAGEAVMTSGALMNYLDDTVPRLFQQLMANRPGNPLLAGQASQRPVVFRRPPREMDLFAAR